VTAPLRFGPLARIKAVDLVLLFAVVSIGLTACFLTWHLNQQLPRERQTREALERIRVDAAQLQALEWRLIPPGKVEARDTLTTALILDDMATQGKAVADLHSSDGSVIAVQALITNFRKLMLPLAAHDLKRTIQAYRTRYLPARIALQHEVVASDRAAERRLRRAEKEVKIGMIVSVFAAVLLIMMLALRVRRIRAREIRGVRKADSELSESNELLSGLSAASAIGRAALPSAGRTAAGSDIHQQSERRRADVHQPTSPPVVGPAGGRVRHTP